MSFSSELKNELSKINNLKNKDEVYAEFLGYFSTISPIKTNNMYKFSTENEYNINRFAKLLSNLKICYKFIYEKIFKNINKPEMLQRNTTTNMCKY